MQGRFISIAQKSISSESTVIISL